MNFEALAKNSEVMTNERSFSVVNASAPVGTTDKLSDFLSCLPGVPPDSCRTTLRLFVITSPSVR
mgnify:CR=1 FL=1